MKNTITTLVFLSVLPFSVLGQNETDVLRFSFDLPGGSARSTALAGAVGAMGGDLGAAQSNPAGLGLYRTSELVFSPSMEFNNTSTDHYGSTTDENRSRFFMNNVGFLINYGPKEGTKWKGSSFGIVYDRTGSLHWDSRAKAEGLSTTLTDQFVDAANGVAPNALDPFFSGLAWYAYILDTVGTQNTYVQSFSDNGLYDQDHFVRTKGSTSNTNIFFAGNLEHKLFIGATIGIASAKFERTTIHKEKTTDMASDLQSFEYREDLTTTGSGLNLKLGVLYRFGDNFRLGAAIHTPTGWSMNDAWVAEVSSEFGNGDSYRELSEEGAFAYRISTPWKYVISSTYVFGKKGLITGEYEFNNLSKAKLKQSSSDIDGYDFAYENEQVSSRFRPIHSIRGGVEWRAGLIYFRGGYGFWPNAYNQNDVQHGDDLSMYAGGVGYRKQQLSFDLGLQHYTRSNTFFTYSNQFVEASESTATSSRVVLTVAFRP